MRCLFSVDVDTVTPLYPCPGFVFAQQHKNNQITRNNQITTPNPQMPHHTYDRLAADMPRIVADGLDVVDVAVILHEVDGMFTLMTVTLETFFGDGAPRGMHGTFDIVGGQFSHGFSAAYPTPTRAG